jgi:hypothetical protein
MFRGVVLTLLLGSPAMGASVVVLNAGFENPALADGAFQRGIPNWTISGFGPGEYNPDITQYPAGASEGQNVGFTQGFNSAWQDLAATLTPLTTYTLQVDFGTAAGLPAFPFELRLNLSDGTILATAPGTASGAFVTTTLSFTTGASDPHFGQALEIFIQAQSLNLNAQLDFDNVRLDASPAAGTPEPGTWTGVAGALLLALTARGSSRRVRGLLRGCRITR